MATSFAHLVTPLHAGAAGCVLLLTACASTPPPTAEVAASQQAVVRADQADADQYAPEQLQLARRLLGDAQLALSAGKANDARALLAAAEAAADLATVRSQQAQVNAQLLQRRAEIAQLRNQLRLEDQP